MANENASPRAIPIPKATTAAGFVAPVVGRIAKRDVTGYFGFTLIKKGDVITETIYARAQHMARLTELIASTNEA
ncbi:MAG TPA: hypothetical protein VGK19_09770 [Capsulimonadaceae bacterium]|jgi:hypothetical protein